MEKSKTITDQIQTLLKQGKKPKEIISLGFAKSTVYQLAKKFKSTEPIEIKEIKEAISHIWFFLVEMLVEELPRCLFLKTLISDDGLKWRDLELEEDFDAPPSKYMVIVCTSSHPPASLKECRHDIHFDFSDNTIAEIHFTFNPHRLKFNGRWCWTINYFFCPGRNCFTPSE